MLKTLQFPDYAGNNMFNTLGNLAIDPHAGLLFVDFELGDTLQITGEARVLWDDESRAAFAGAERVVEMRVTGRRSDRRRRPAALAICGGVAV